VTGCSSETPVAEQLESGRVSATWEDFERLQVVVGSIMQVDDFPEARDPAYKLMIDFGPLGMRASSAQITHYPKDALVGRQVVCVLGFGPKRVAGFKSEVLVMGGISAQSGVVLLRPDTHVEPGTLVG
jgi:tRNA-binding protein